MTEKKKVPFWTDIDTIPTRYPWLDNDESCDVCVVGGGVSGAITAMVLAQKGISTILVTAKPLGFGKTSAAQGCVRCDCGDSLSQLSQKIGLKKALCAYNDRAMSLEKLKAMSSSFDFPVDFDLRDCVTICGKEDEADELFEEYELRRVNGFDTEYIDAMASGRLFPFESEGVMITPNAAAQVDPFMLVHAAAVETVRAGGNVIENTKVLNINNESGKNVLSTSTRKKIVCNKVVLAMGAKNTEYINGSGAVKISFSAVSRPFDAFNDGWHDRCIVSTFSRPGVTVCSTRDNRVFAEGAETAIVDKRGMLTTIIPKLGIAKKRFCFMEEYTEELFPSVLMDFEYEYQTSSVSTYAGLPVVDRHPEFPNCFFITCPGSSSILDSFTGAELIAAMCSGENADDRNIYTM